MRLSPVTRSYVFKGRKNSKKESSLIEGMSTKHLRQSGPGNKSWIEEEKATDSKNLINFKGGFIVASAMLPELIVNNCCIGTAMINELYKRNC
ncbi:hypothetical protein M513_08178 [Trichuris suis]|uniref:Uncharacterized protein n=1 Tax=Trichuris suis TaxID=68888 RepID=A0A085M199_9BILA|nr:hypothetical protein M513_08178 [Trichuris suis]